MFYIQPINKQIDPFPIHVRFSESGFANDENIIVKFVATDGDHFYDIFHDLFLKQILEMIKVKKKHSF